MIKVFSSFLLLASLSSANGLASDAPKTKAQCNIHHIRLVQAESPILYGKPVTSDEYSSARESQFPNALESCVFGGCEPRSTKKTKVMICPQCNEVRKQWLSNHPVKDART